MTALRTEMTHGDKAKAKAAKSSKASVRKAGPQSGENGKRKAVVQAGKAAGKGTQGNEGVKTGQAGAQAGSQGSAKKAAGAEKGAAGGKKTSSAAKEPGRGADAKNKASAPAEAAGGGFNNPVISAAFREALKKYPNAFRKLTD